MVYMRALLLGALPLARVHVAMVDPLLLVLMLAGAAIRLQADVLAYALVSTGHDRAWVRVNLLALAAAPLLAVALVSVLGTIGAGLQLLVNAVLLFVLRRRLLAAIIAAPPAGSLSRA